MSSTEPTDLLRPGAVALVLAVGVNVIIVFATTSTGAIEPFRALSYPPVATLTAVGVIGATVVYAVIRRRSDNPNRTFAIVAVVVLLVSFVPDIVALPGMPGATTAAIVVLMAMHVTTAGIAYGVLTRR